MGRVAAVLGRDHGKALETMLAKFEDRGSGQTLIYENSSYRLGELNRSDRERQDPHDHYGLVFTGRPIYAGKQLDRAELLDLYQKLGPGFITGITGNFVIIISNGREFFIARDPYGAQPLYISLNGDQILLASELKSLCPLTDSIEIFPPGYYYTEAKELKRFQEITPPTVTAQHTVEEAASTLKELLTSAVARVLQENHHAGFFLSGGLDSSVVVAAACKTLGQNLPTLAVGLENSDDIICARRVAKYLHTKHYEYLYTPEEMLGVLPKVIYHLESFDVELVNSAIANYLVAKLAHDKGLRVVLSGEGADELFAGYHHLKGFKGEGQLNQELIQLLRGLHNGALQRVDRMTQVYSVECIMPFMEPRVVEFALGLPGNYKVSSSGIEKWILRRAFISELPPDVVWRSKAQFGIGTGNAHVMQGLVEERVSHEEYAAARARSRLKFKDKVEYYYYKIFKSFFPTKLAEETVNRWLV